MMSVEETQHLLQTTLERFFEDDQLSVVDVHHHYDLTMGELNWNELDYVQMVNDDFRRGRGKSYAAGLTASIADFATPPFDVDLMGGIICNPNMHMYLAVGLHPRHVQGRAYNIKLMGEVADLSSSSRFRDRMKAVGETGLDLREGVNLPPEEEQVWVLRQHCALAKALELPLLLHMRGERALTRSMEVLCEEDMRGHQLHWHCFDESAVWLSRWFQVFPNTAVSLACKIIDVSETEEATRRAGVVGWIPRDRLMVETDAPYCISPAVEEVFGRYLLTYGGNRPYRGTHPGLALAPALWTAMVTGQDPVELVKQVRKNTTAFYGV